MAKLSLIFRFFELLTSTLVLGILVRQQKNSTSTAPAAPAAKISRRDETGSSMLQFMKERAAMTNARDKTFLEGMNIFRENEKKKLEDHLLLRIEKNPPYKLKKET